MLDWLSYVVATDDETRTLTSLQREIQRSAANADFCTIFTLSQYSVVMRMSSTDDSSSELRAVSELTVLTYL